MTFRGLVLKGDYINPADRRKDAIEDEVDIGLGAKGAGKRFCAARGVAFDGATQFEEGGVQFAPAEEKIPISPGDLRGLWVSTLGVKKRIARCRKIAFRFINGSEIRPYVRGTRVQSQSSGISANGAGGVGILEAVLPVAAEQIPIAEVVWFQASGSLIPFPGLQIRVVNGKRISNAEIREKQSGEEGDGEKYAATRGTGEA
jgi:hypothetical protein